MKLSITAITLINNSQTRMKLGLALGFTEGWTINLLRKNKENGPLTTAKALQVIERETGLKQNEILVSEEPARA